ncbi:MAG TPA: hypothetical protein VFF04_01660 [Candidatus Babeliales bacterium]|nr:hypothetical protein [Candidatus Babeliales bacterium]
MDKKYSLFLIMIFTCSLLYTADWFNTQKDSILGIICAPVTYVYHYFKKTAESSIIGYTEDEVVDTLLLTLKPNKQCTSLELFKKAQHISRRRRIMAILEQQYPTALIEQQQGIITLRRIFGVMDIWRARNPYEDQERIKEVGMIDNLIDTKMAESIMIGLKPWEICTPEEQAHRKQAADRRKHIMEKLQLKVNSLPKKSFERKILPILQTASYLIDFYDIAAL